VNPWRFSGGRHRRSGPWCAWP